MDSKIGYLVHFVGFCVNTIGFVYGTFVAYDYDGVSSVLQYRGWPGKLKYLTYWCEVSFRFCWTTSYVGGLVLWIYRHAILLVSLNNSTDALTGDTISLLYHRSTKWCNGAQSTQEKISFAQIPRLFPRHYGNTHCNGLLILCTCSCTSSCYD